MRFLFPLFALSILLLGACAPAPASEANAPASSEAMEDTDTPSPDSAMPELLSGKHTVTLKTSKGDITLELDADLAPKTVTNFVTHARDGYYDNLTFHRVIPGFMIQGGDPTGTGAGGDSIYGGDFEDEIDPSNAVYAGGYKKGAVAMANRGPDTNGSQFFIMDSDYPLPPNYTIFGRVTKGQDVVAAIARVERDGRDKPLTPVTFTPELK